MVALSQLLALTLLLQLTQLTRDEDFKGTQAPDWVLDGVAKVFLPIDDTKAIDEATEAGATVLHAGGPSPYYPLRKDDPKSGIPSEEFKRLKDGVAYAKSKGMRVVLGISPYAPIEIVRQHPDWIHHPTDDPAIQSRVQLDLNTPENIGLRGLPLNTPYGDYAIECLAEMMRDLQVDGFSFDGCYHPMMNFSPFERELYQKERQRDLPARIDLKDPAYVDYLLWADEKLEDWYRKLGHRLREVNPESAIYTWTTNAGRFGHFLTSPRVMSARMNRLIDCPVQEWWLDEVNLGSTVIPYFGAAYVRAVSGGKVGASEPYLMSHGNPYSADSFPAHELTVRCLGAMTNGSFTPLAQMAGKEATLQTLREIAKRGPWFTRLTADPWAALLVSENTRQFYAYGNIVERWLSHIAGVYRVGMEEHFPLNLITEQDLSLESLKKYRVLFLPNVACLSDKHVAIIKQYVAEGGGLVATCETSLCDELGRARPDFALADLFGTHYQGRQSSTDYRPEIDANFAIAMGDDYWIKRGQVGAFRFSDFSNSIFATEARLKKLLPNMQATFKGPLVRPAKFDPQMTPAILYFPEGSRDAYPMAAYGSYGKGRVVYFAAGVDAAMFSYSFPYQRVILATAISWAAQEPYAIRVKAPMCVQTTFWKKPDGRTIIHLWNGLNTTSDHGLQEGEVPLREESIPIHGIELDVTGLKFTSARFEPSGIPLQQIEEKGRRLLRLPPLEIHGTVVLEH